MKFLLNLHKWRAILLKIINLKCKLIDLYQDFGWDLYDKFDHAYDAFKLCLTDPELVFSKININK